MKRIFLFLLTNFLIMFTVMLITRVFGLGHYMTAYGINYQALAVFCLIWGMVGSFISLAISKWMAKTMMGVQLVDDDPSFSRLTQAVHGFAKQAGIQKMPEVGIYDSPEINAFATGPSKNNSLVAVSTGLLNNMTEDEIEGVLAHEVSHIANGDMVTMTLVQGVVNAFVMFFAKIATWAIVNAMRGDDDRGPGIFVQIIIQQIFYMVFGFLGMFVVSGFSRFREYRADAGGAFLAGKDKMIRALQKLQANYETLTQVEEHKEVAAFQISSKGGIMSFLSTHPSLDDRIEALKKMNA